MMMNDSDQLTVVLRSVFATQVMIQLFLRESGEKRTLK